jgi:trk system potassium uptake protein TrkH
LGPGVGPSGAVDGFSASAKWLMIAGMVLGRLELMAVLVLFLPRFWRS